MDILILGGTKFLGRHLVDAALARGHVVTLFNRGQTNPDLFPGVEKLTGDRDGDLHALRSRRWDAVIDPSGYLPRVVRQSAELLKDAASHYTFISSISVYADFAKVGLTEDDAVGTLEDEASEDVSEFYGPLKARCEQEVERVFGDCALMIRPGLIVGPYDPTDRFTYWVHRFAKGGEVLVPGAPHRLIQFIDARDLAQWTMAMVEQKASGVFNATGPREPLTMGQFVSVLERELPNSGRATWVSEDFLRAAGVSEWSDLPLWISEQTGWPGFMASDIGKALASHIDFRPLQETVVDTFAWDEGRKVDTLGAGLDRSRESTLLGEWHEESGRHD